jgi:tetratricopeptide (TPR) repeat protein
MGAIRGAVRNAAGKQVASATVVLRGRRGETVLSTKTDSHGAYGFAAVRAGVYRAVAAREGYETNVRPGLRVTAGSTVKLDFVLNLPSKSYLSKSSVASLSEIRFYQQPALKTAQLTDPAAGGGYSDSASARGREMLKEYLGSPGWDQSALLPPGHRPESNAGSLARLQQAAVKKPSEANFRRLGSGLLTARRFFLASQAFRRGVARYPHSTELWTGLGISLYSQGRYNDAVQALIRAVELHPAGSQAYDFLSEASRFASRPDGEALLLLKRFAATQPQNARAHYDYALSLWRKPQTREAPTGLSDVESELDTAIALNPRFADARLQLGALYDAEKLTALAIQQYQAIIRLEPGLAAAHYRLAQDYLRAGNKIQSRAEFEVYEKLAQVKP